MKVTVFLLAGLLFVVAFAAFSPQVRANSSGTWAILNPMTYPVADGAGATDGSQFYVAGGYGVGFYGISTTYPTGSPEVNTTGQLWAYDMSTRTANGTGLTDFSAANHAAWIVGAGCNVVSGSLGTALNFPGANTCYVNGTKPNVGYTYFSEVLWFKPWTTGAQMVISLDTAGVNYVSDGILFSNKITARVNVGVTTSSTVALQTEYALVAVRNSTVTYLWLNGAFIGSNSGGSGTGTLNWWHIGGWVNSDWYNGTVDEYEAFSRILTPQEVQSLSRLHSSQSNLDVRASMQIYNPVLDTWRQGAPMPTPRWGAAAVYWNGSVYVFAGQGNSSLTSKTEAFGVSNDTWYARTSVPAGLTCQGLMALAVRGPTWWGIWIMCGTSVYRYSPDSNSFTALASSAHYRRWSEVALVGDSVFVINGYSSSIAVNTVDVYSIASDSWTLNFDSSPAPAYGQLRENPVINGTIYIAYGFDGFVNFYSNTFAYDQGNKSWSVLQSGFNARDGVASAVIHDRIYVTGGRNVVVGPYGLNDTAVFSPPSSPAPITPSTSDLVTWLTFLLLLIALALILVLALVRDAPTLLIPAGIFVFLISFQAWNVTASIPASISLVVVGLVFLFEGIPRQGPGD